MQTQSNQPSGQTSKVRELRLPDLNNKPDARTLFSYDGAVSLEIYVQRDSRLLRRRLPAPYVTTVGWSSRNGLTAVEAREFSDALQEGLARAEAETQRRNALDAESGGKQKPRNAAR